MTRDLDAAAAAWKVENESIDSINRRIHDGVPLDQLKNRADNFLRHSANIFPQISGFNFARILEIGSGVGFILEAIERSTSHMANRDIIGLDISESMIGRAKERIGQNPAFKNQTIRFIAYGGITVPLPDNYFDFIYSFASLQHIPKPYVYNLFFEVKRLLKPQGCAVLNFLPFSVLPNQEKNWPWQKEVAQQVRLTSGDHWHHFYSLEELRAVLTQTGFGTIQLAEGHYVYLARQHTALPAKRGGIMRHLFGRR